MRERIHSYLGFARKSRNLISGYNTCLYGIQKRKVKLLILAADLSENTLEKFRRLCESQKVEYRICLTAEQLSMYAGEEGKGIFGVTDQKFADVISKEIDQMK
ncbi:MAG: ribosomal L7Ae/L30e/S12e/Gadd45 family protein [Firmicutes bacterium]|nr:ribosomal L7Ae/L30e/S12e/Gadd45 family protein [Bacillota bacterium]